MSAEIPANQENQKEMSFVTFSNIHQDIKLLTVAITELRNDMHHPPCDIMKNHIENHGGDVKELRKELIDHKKMHDDKTQAETLEIINNKKFVQKIETIVIAGLVLALLTGACGLIYVGIIKDVDSKIAADK